MSGVCDSIEPALRRLLLLQCTNKQRWDKILWGLALLTILFGHSVFDQVGAESSAPKPLKYQSAAALGSTQNFGVFPLAMIRTSCHGSSSEISNLQRLLSSLFPINTVDWVFHIGRCPKALTRRIRS